MIRLARVELSAADRPPTLSAEECAALSKGERVLLGLQSFVVVSSPGDPDHPMLSPPPWTVFHPTALESGRLHLARERRGAGATGYAYSEVGDGPPRLAEKDRG